MSFERISDDCIVWVSNGTEPSQGATCPRCAELETIGVNLQQQAAQHYQARLKAEARLALVSAKSNRRRKALRELNRAIGIYERMVADMANQNATLRGKLNEKSGVLRRIWRKLFIEYLRHNPAARAELRDAAMMEEAAGSAGLASESLQCQHGYFRANQNCPHCGWKVREG